MTPRHAIEVAHATKIYQRFGRRHQFTTLKSALIGGTLVKDLRPEETFAAVQDVSFDVPAGSTFGIVGRNGSGKSTMLKLVAGITKPTYGHVKVDGRISALIELGAGFHPEISGRENVFINGIMLGLSKREITKRFDEIVEFAELKEFIDEPVKTYSSGMYMRLGFAVAIHVDPDVLLIDEVLAVGDEAFTHKCLDKFGDFRRRGKTILLVTHSLNLVERFCDEAVWLDQGRLRATGDPRRVTAQYVTDVAKTEEQELAAADARARQAAASAPAEPPPAVPADVGTQPASQAAGQPGPGEAEQAPTDMFRAREGRWGSREIEILDVTFVGGNGQPGHIFQSGEPVRLVLKVRARQQMDDFVFGVGIFNADGVCCYGTNTDIEQMLPESISGEGEVHLQLDSLSLTEGTYRIDVAVHRRDGYPYDYHRLLYSFRVKSRVKDVGIFRPPHAWSFLGDIRLRPAGASTSLTADPSTSLKADPSTPLAADPSTPLRASPSTPLRASDTV